MGPHEPYWQTNTSFSPPPARWDFRFPSDDELPYDSHDGSLLYGSSASSNSKGSRLTRGDNLYHRHHSASDGTGLFFDSPDLSRGPQWTPPAIQEINVDDYEAAIRRNNKNDQILEHLPSTPSMEFQVTSDNPGSISSHSDSSESEHTFNSCLSSHRNFSNRRSFLSKPIHPLFFPIQTPKGASVPATAGFSEYDVTPLRKDSNRWSSGSSSTSDLADVSEQFESEISSGSCILSDGFKCGLCERFLIQRSPWSTRRIVRNGDLPISGVLSCRHFFHAECLEQITPKSRKSDPPCPLCARLEEEYSPENRALSKFRNSFPRFRPFSEDGTSRPWGCMQVGDCIEGTLHTPQRNNIMLLNRDRIRKNLSLKSNSSKEFPGKLRKTGLCSSQMMSGKSVDLGAIGCSKSMAGPTMK